MTTVAPAAQSVLDQATRLWPNRSRLSDGTVGDPAHAARVSDHNPDSRGIVHAADLTHDPAHGVDTYRLADQVRLNAKAGHEPRLKYVISNRRIASPTANWVWRYYDGDNPHTQHMHVSVNSGSVENDTTPWFVEPEPPPLTDQQKRAVLAAARTLIREHPRPRLRYRHPNFLRGNYVKEVQRALTLPVTGRYGVGTYNGVRKMQRIVGLEQTGEVNQETWVWIIYFAMVKAFES